MDRNEALAIGTRDAHDQAALVASGEVSAAELVEAAIIRIDALNPHVNAISHRSFDEARRKIGGAGRMPVPYLIKEGLPYCGMPSRFGSRAFVDAPPGSTEFPFTRRLDDQGLIALGKTTAPEFALLPSTEGQLYGATRNPWSLDRSAGGSSGGAAAAVASGMVALAHASDGGGSIRIPASCCGLVGLKPGRGAHVRARGQHVIEDLIVADTLLARTVRDVVWATTVTSIGGFAIEPARPLRIGVAMTSLEGEQPDDDVRAAVERAAHLCAALGHQVDIAPPRIDGFAIASAFKTIWGYLANEAFTSVGDKADQLEPWTIGMARWGASFGPDALECALTDVAVATDAWRAISEACDIILSPVVRDPPPPIGLLSPMRSFEALRDDMFGYVAYTQLHNLIGVPALSLPIGTTPGGLPIGCMIAGPCGGEAMLLALAAQLEEAEDWPGRWPAMSAAHPEAIPG
jgi:amidase